MNRDARAHAEPLLYILSILKLRDEVFVKAMYPVCLPYGYADFGIDHQAGESLAVNQHDLLIFEFSNKVNRVAGKV